MKKLLLLLLVCLPLVGEAKDKKDKLNPKYLSGAVTMEDGKVSFTKELKTLGIPRKQVFNQMLDWAEKRFKPDGKLYSKVVYADEEKGEIAVTAEEYLIFSSSALSLDRTRIYYQYLIFVEDGVCKMTMKRIRYWYDENRDGGEKYVAEEWITDDMALNKKKDKLAPICGKFRRETIDLKDQLFASAAAVLGQKLLDDSSELSQDIPLVPLKAALPLAADSGKLQKVDVSVLPPLDEMAKNGRITLSVNGEETDLKLENWGGLGKLFEKTVVYLLIDKSRIAASAMMEQADSYEVSFYLSGLQEPSVVISCRKSMTQKMSVDELKSLSKEVDVNKEYTMYVGEVFKSQLRK